MAGRRTIAFSTPQIEQLRKVLQVKRDETLPGIRRRTAVSRGVSTKYDGMFAISDITDYSVEFPDYKISVKSGTVQINRSFYTIGAAGVELDLPAWAYGTDPAWGWVVVDIFLDPETVAPGEPEWDIIQEVSGVTLDINYGRLIIGRASVLENEETGRGKMLIVQDQYGAAFMPIWGECPEPEE